MAKKRDITDGEHAFWKKATEDTKPIDRHDIAPLERPDPVHSPRFRKAMEQRHKQGQVDVFRERSNPKEIPLQPFKKIKTKDLIPQARLDLHGNTTEQAEQRLTQFLARAQSEDKRMVLVITGKGEGILKEWFVRWLQLNHGQIISYKRAPDNLGGDGAFILHVRKLKD